MTDVLLIVDVQNDFLPDGALGVRGGDEIVPIINRLQECFELVVVTMDWHPPGHGSFASTHGKEPGEVIDLDGLPQILWPDHCVQNTQGSELAPGFHTERIAQTFFKGVDGRIDSYGAFYDNGWRRSTGLEGYLRERGVDHVTIVGLTTDYCVKYSALDATKLGFAVTVVRDACRPVNLDPGDEAKALEEMRAVGVCIVTSDELL